ncbi:hypothetical protein [Schleiferilactobacillus shenzhenensis]|uniref:Uncharacterized protein n=1 Tax=Schleiferilactobacillus shenzhenensis LY-73 TaxID=1231336 RepID=U4TQJ2_9LACO|nr:hypothetical protein [Schleiferilactobacillus shenzhenensis]ERL64173.1 hypothetical protein L248_1539 [Schleiferilactobacillus shenzhenensis LY-73]
MTKTESSDPQPPPTRYQRWLISIIAVSVLIGLMVGLALHDIPLGLMIGATVGAGGGMAVADCMRTQPKRNHA